MYFNTNNLKGDELKKEFKNAKKQDDIILQIFGNGSKLTPFDVQKFLLNMDIDYPITSIRRSISVLTDLGKLVKLDEMRKGKYNKPNHLWQIKGHTHAIIEY